MEVLLTRGCLPYVEKLSVLPMLALMPNKVRDVKTMMMMMMMMVNKQI